MTPERPYEIVLASAGSGKTHRLTLRAIGLLVRGVPIDRLLASTFTRKAAGEILDRILGRLAKAASSEEETAALAADLAAQGVRVSISPDQVCDILAGAVERFDRVRVQTLDSFFDSLARHLALDLDVPPGWRIAEDHEDALLRELAAERALAALPDDDRLTLLDLLTTKQAIGSDIRGPLLDAIDDCLGAFMLAGRSLAPFGMIKPTTAPLPEAEVLVLAEAIESAELPVNASNGQPSKPWKNAVAKVAELIRREDWRGLLATTIVGSLRKSPPTYSRHELTGRLAVLLTAARDHAASLVIAALAQRNLAAGALTAAFDREYRSLQESLGLIRFEDVPHLLAEAANGDRLRELLYQLDGRIDHLLLDEYQDTSVVQERLMLPVMDELLEKPDRSVFVVGDPKQSLYGWRHAEPELLETLGARRSIAVTTLETSWRCAQAVLDAANEVFAAVTHCPMLSQPPLDRVAQQWAERYRPHTAQHGERSGLVRLEVGDAQLEGRLDRAAAIAHECLDASGTLSIAVLLRANKHVQPMIARLGDLGIKASEEGGGVITDTPATQAAVCLFRLASHPGDTLAAHVVLASPLAGMRELGDAGSASHQQARRLSASLRQTIAQHGCARLVARVIEHAGHSMTTREQARLQQLARLAWEIDAAGASPTELVAVASKASRPMDSDDHVRVMTFHKSKGLEFDAVVLPDLDWSMSPRASGMLVDRPDIQGPIERASLWPAAAVRDAHPDLTRMHAQHAQRSVSEGLSALYVAMTRARSRLDMIVAPPKQDSATPTPAVLLRHALPTNDDGVWQHPPDGSWPTNDRPHDSQASPAFQTAPPRPVLTPSATLRTGRLRRVTPSEGGGAVTATDLLRSSTRASDRGTRWHRWFESIEWLDDLPSAQDLAGGEHDRLDAEAFAEVLRGGIGDALRREFATLHSNETLDLRREWPFAVRVDEPERAGALATGRVDRLTLVRDGDGRAVRAIIDDLKTDAVTPDGLDDAIEQHRPQLAVYRRAVAAAFGLEHAAVRTRLLFTAIGTVAEVD